VSNPSWRKVPYGMRPAKHVERKMLVEALSRLDVLHPLPNWRYIGMGSLWFTDFALFHRRLGIEHLHSIENEQDLELQERFRRNAPFSTHLHFGRTTSELPDVPWDLPAIVWLDYDDVFHQWMLQDVDHIIANCVCPTVLLFSVNVSPGNEEGRRKELVDRVGSEDRLPTWARRDTDLGGEPNRRGMANAIREVMTDQIQSALSDRGDKDRGYEQLFHFRYSDGASMLTFGGVLSSGSTADCNFSSLPFYRPSNRPFVIKVPVITLREGLQLEALLPGHHQPTRLPGVSSAEVETFKLLYRYLPSFVDADL